MSTPMHIVVVEDEEHLAQGIRYNLEAEGYRVTTISDGASALQMLQDPESDVDLIVLDIMLPQLSGYAICDTLRKAGDHTPVLLLSARTLPEDRARGFDVGANQYLTKPFDLDELLSRVKNLLRLGQQQRAGGSAPPVAHEFRFANCIVNFDSYEVTIGEECVRLTRQEMKLLRYFIENEGRVIPRSELLETIWEMPGHLNTRAPDQFILRLRRIFETDPSSPRHFLTIRDAGYRFVANPDDSG